MYSVQGNCACSIVNAQICTKKDQSTSVHEQTHCIHRIPLNQLLSTILPRLLIVGAMFLKLSGRLTFGGKEKSALLRRDMKSAHRLLSMVYGAVFCMYAIAF